MGLKLLTGGLTKGLWREIKARPLQSPTQVQMTHDACLRSPWNIKKLTETQTITQKLRSNKTWEASIVVVTLWIEG